MVTYQKNYRAPEEEGLKGKVYVTFVVEKTVH
jgi:protein TonB